MPHKYCSLWLKKSDGTTKIYATLGTNIVFLIKWALDMYKEIKHKEKDTCTLDALTIEECIPNKSYKTGTPI